MQTSTDVIKTFLELFLLQSCQYSPTGCYLFSPHDALLRNAVLNAPRELSWPALWSGLRKQHGVGFFGPFWAELTPDYRSSFAPFTLSRGKSAAGRPGRLHAEGSHLQLNCSEPDNCRGAALLSWNITPSLSNGRSTEEYFPEPLFTLWGCKLILQYIMCPVAICENVVAKCPTRVLVFLLMD